MYTIRVCVYIYIYTYIYVCMCMCVYIYIYIYIYTYICTDMYTHIFDTTRRGGLRWEVGGRPSC